MDRKPLEELDAKLRAAAAEKQPPGLAYAVIRHGHLVASGSYGLADVEENRSWGSDTLCRLFSMTKTVAACGLMALVEDGAVSLDDRLSKYLPEFAAANLQVAANEDVAGPSEDNLPAAQEITLKHLLTHTSGLSYASAMGDEPSCPTEASYSELVTRVDSGDIASLAQWCQELSRVPLRFQPGEMWEYSYALEPVGRVIELTSGKSLDVFLRERILEPLGMDDTAFAVPESKASRLANFYRRQGEGEAETLQNVDSASSGSLWVEPRQTNVLSAGGAVGSVAGGLVSSMDDFARLCLMLQQGGLFQGRQILRPETVRSMCENMLPEITGKADSWCLSTAGLGFGVLGSVAVPHPDKNWFDIPGEVGWGGLAGTAWAMIPEDGVVTLTFCQVMYELWIDEEVRKAVRKSMGVHPPPEEEEGSASNETAGDTNIVKETRDKVAETVAVVNEVARSLEINFDDLVVAETSPESPDSQEAMLAPGSSSSSSSASDEDEADDRTPAHKRGTGIGKKRNASGEPGSPSDAESAEKRSRVSYRSEWQIDDKCTSHKVGSEDPIRVLATPLRRIPTGH